jgi:DNA-binding transcriptional ArsR family regulator
VPSRPHERFLHPEQVAPLRGRVLSVNDAEHAALLFAMLSDPTRARVLHALSLADELCVQDLATLLEVGQSALSHQLRLLRDNGVVRRRKAGRVAYYQLADEDIRALFHDGLRRAQQRSPARGREAGTAIGGAS